MSTSWGKVSIASVKAYKKPVAKDLEGFEISDYKGDAASMGAF